MLLPVQSVDKDDLQSINNAIKHGLAAQCLGLGTDLGLPSAFLDTVKSGTDNHEERLRVILTEWLRWNYDYEVHRKPSWRRLVQAVDQRHRRLANSIAEEHKGKIMHL